MLRMHAYGLLWQPIYFECESDALAVPKHTGSAKTISCSRGTLMMRQVLPQAEACNCSGFVTPSQAQAECVAATEQMHVVSRQLQAMQHVRAQLEGQAISHIKDLVRLPQKELPVDWLMKLSKTQLLHSCAQTGQSSLSQALTSLSEGSSCFSWPSCTC